MSTELLFGIHSIEAALNYDAGNIAELYVESGQQNPRVRDLAERARDMGIKPHARDRADLDRMTGGARHQGIAAMYKAPPPRSEGELPALVEGAGQEALFLILDGVTDPHNLGACLRSADGAGAHAVIAPKDHAVGINATVAKVASGAAETVPYFMVTNLARTLGELKERGIWVLGTSGDADKSLYQADLQGPVALVLGAEGAGLRQLTRKSCDELLHIPMQGAVESLNVSVASALCLYEALRQRRAAG